MLSVIVFYYEKTYLDTQDNHIYLGYLSSEFLRKFWKKRPLLKVFSEVLGVLGVFKYIFTIRCDSEAVISIYLVSGAGLNLAATIAPTYRL